MNSLIGGNKFPEGDGCLVARDCSQRGDAAPREENGLVNGHRITQVETAPVSAGKKRVTFYLSDEGTSSMTNTNITDVTRGTDSPITGIFKNAGEADILRDVPDAATGSYSRQLSEAYYRLHASTQAVPRPVDDSIVEKYQQALKLLSDAIDVTAETERKKGPVRVSFFLWREFAANWNKTLEHYCAIDTKFRNFATGLGARVGTRLKSEKDSSDKIQDSFSTRYYDLLKQDELLMGEYNHFAEALLNKDARLQSRIASDIQARQKVITLKTEAIDAKENSKMYSPAAVEHYDNLAQKALREVHNNNRSTALLQESYVTAQQAVSHALQGNLSVGKPLSKIARLQKELSAAIAANNSGEIIQKKKVIHAYQEAIDPALKAGALIETDSFIAQSRRFIAGFYTKRALSIEKNESPEVAKNYEEAIRLLEKEAIPFVEKSDKSENQELAAAWMKAAEFKNKAAQATAHGNRTMAHRWNVIAEAYEKGAGFQSEGIQAASEGHETLAQSETLKSEQAKQRADRLLQALEDAIELRLI